MSYAKAMKWNKKHPKGIKQLFNGFSLLQAEERRRSPWHGKAFIDQLLKLTEEEGNELLRHTQAKWDEETARLQRLNPNLKIVD